MPHLVDWCPDKDNPTSQRPGKHDEKYDQTKSEFNRATTTQEIKQTHSTHKTKNKNKNKNNQHIIHIVNNSTCTKQLDTHYPKTQTLSSTSHAPSTMHTTKSVPYIADDKIGTIYLEYVKEQTEKDRLHQLKMAEIREQYEKEEEEKERLFQLEMEEYEKEEKEKDRLHQLKMAEIEKERKENDQKWEQFMQNLPQQLYLQQQHYHQQHPQQQYYYPQHPQQQHFHQLYPQQQQYHQQHPQQFY